MLHIGRSRGNKRAFLVALAVAAVLAMSLGATFISRSGGASGGAGRFGEAIAQLTGPDASKPAATVNGAVIPLGKIRAFELLTTAPGGFERSRPVDSMREYLELLIDEELLYQEAVRRGYDPSDDEVLKVAREMKAAGEQFLSEDNPAAADLREVFKAVEGTPYHLSVYDSSPEMLDAFRRQLATNNVRGDVTDRLSAAGRQDSVAVEKAVAEFVRELRKSATIEILITLP